MDKFLLTAEDSWANLLTLAIFTGSWDLIDMKAEVSWPSKCDQRICCDGTAKDELGMANGCQWQAGKLPAHVKSVPESEKMHAKKEKKLIFQNIVIFNDLKKKQQTTTKPKTKPQTTLQGSASDFCSLLKNQVTLSFIFLFDHLFFSFSSPSTSCFFGDQGDIGNDRRKRKRKKSRWKSQNEKKLNISRHSDHIPCPLERKLFQSALWVFLPLVLNPSRKRAWRTLAQAGTSRRWDAYSAAGVGLAGRWEGL